MLLLHGNGDDLGVAYDILPLFGIVHVDTLRPSLREVLLRRIQFLESDSVTHRGKVALPLLKRVPEDEGLPVEPQGKGYGFALPPYRVEVPVVLQCQLEQCVLEELEIIGEIMHIDIVLRASRQSV